MNCAGCDEPILTDEVSHPIPAVFGDLATAIVHFHHECFLRRFIGGLNHLKGKCTCCGGTLPPDPPELTNREAARQAVAYWEARERPLKPLR